MAAFALLVVWSCRTPLVRRAPSLRFAPTSRSEPQHPAWLLAAEFSRIMLGMFLFSERTWKHHCVTLVLPCAVILYFLAVERPRPALRCFLIGLLSAVALLMASPTPHALFTW